MQITKVKAHNWRNFKTLEFSLDRRLVVVGPNASGKSNLLDLFRFLGDISRPGGGLAAAIDARGGLSKTRSLFARNYHNGELNIEVTLTDEETTWLYQLSIKGEKGGHNRPMVVREVVKKDGRTLLSRPDENDENDRERCTQTHLEQISANQEFRPVADHFAKTSYFHLVPQVIRHGQVGTTLGDPEFGSSMIAEMNGTQPKTRDARLRKITRALQSAVPGFESLQLKVDSAGRPHLIAGYRHWRKNPTEQDEGDFSDGTLRLIGLLWTIISTPANGGVLLLEEPELSLNSAVVRRLAEILATAQRGTSIQVILSTHAPELLDDEGIRAEEVLVLRVTDDGTVAELLSEIDAVRPELEAELPFSEITGQLISPEDLRPLIRAVGS